MLGEEDADIKSDAYAQDKVERWRNAEDQEAANDESLSYCPKLYLFGGSDC